MYGRSNHSGLQVEWSILVVLKFSWTALGAQSHFLSAELESEADRQRHDFVQFDLSTGPSQISPTGQPGRPPLSGSATGNGASPPCPVPSPQHSPASIYICSF